MKEVGQAEDSGVMKCHKEDHQWLDSKVIENLPVAIKKCKDSQNMYKVYKCKHGIPKSLSQDLLLTVNDI